jgi:flagellar basal body-associated protein FliL
MKNIKVLIPVLLLVVGGVYKFVLAPKPVVPKPKIEGSVYVMPKDFLINLRAGKFAKLNAALVLKEGYLEEAVKAATTGEATTPPAGYGTLPQEAAVRAIITDALTDQPASRLQREKTRVKLQKDVLKRIEHETDVEVKDVLFTDLAIQ